MVSVILRMCIPIFRSGKSVVLESWFCVAKVITELKDKSMYAEPLIKKRCYWPKVVHGDLIDTNFEDKESSDAGIVEAITEDNKLFRIFA